MTPAEETRLRGVEERAKRAEERIRGAEDQIGMHWRRMEDMENRADRQIAEKKKDDVDMMIVNGMEIAAIVLLLLCLLKLS